MRFTRTREERVWLYLATTVLLLFIFAFLAKYLRCASAIPTTKDAALVALLHIREWAKWMSGIQTATIASLLYLVFDRNSGAMRPLREAVRFVSLVALVFLGAGLFSSAWVLSSLSSHALRLGNICAPALSKKFDIYETGAFGWTPDWLTLGYLLSVTHWLWAVGLLAVGGTVISLMRPRPATDDSSQRGRRERRS